MRGGDEAPLFPTETFILKHPKSHYQIPVRSQYVRPRADPENLTP
ncbi:uncharacterized protein DNG_08593 [Cephalotrichum gorgonifer]|uniref:Uncharacterized protein n=1 Tax=Cephalotrichum gorgonifer TaxID=2041049 RepID=A0AAE8N5D4_9PEZI|nr:uncharacterized protein DNG_08593 [Cephalotrichum gorgonifer]